MSIGEEEVSLYLVPTLAMCTMAMSGMSSTLVLCSIFIQHHHSLILNILLVIFILLYRILGHNASLGCNKCIKKFSVTFGSPINYSGFERSTWTLRTGVFTLSKLYETFTERENEDRDKEVGV